MEKRMSDPALLVTTDARGVATVTLNRPDKRNALDDQQVRALTEAFAALDRAPDVRAVVLAGRGQAFSAGADLDYMQRMAAASEGENITDATAIAEMLRTLDRLGKPTVARVHGAAYAAARTEAFDHTLLKPITPQKLRHVLNGHSHPHQER